MRQVIFCKMISFVLMYMGWIYMELKMCFNKDKALRVHNSLVLACPRPQASHYHLVITVNLEASPTLTPCPTPYVELLELALSPIRPETKSLRAKQHNPMC